MCPWDSDNSTGPTCDSEDLFPTGFVPLPRQFVKNFPSNIHSRGYYNALWRCVCDTIRQDVNLRSCPLIAVCVEEVIKETMWWEEIGRNIHALEPTPASCFEMDDAIVFKPTTPTSKRGGTQQPQAVGQRKKRIIGNHEVIPGASVSSDGQWLPAVPPPTSATVGPVAHTREARRIGEASATVTESPTQEMAPTPT
jgi:hypothetical protein